MIRAAMLIAAAVAGAASAPAHPPDATYTYSLVVNGNQIGTSTIAVDSATADSLTVKEVENVAQPHITAVATMHYDPLTLRETSYSADFSLASGARHVDITVKPTTMTVVAVPGGSVDIPADPSAPLELVGDNLAGSAMLIPALLHASGATAFTIAVLAGGEGVVTKVSADAAPSRPSSVPAGDTSLTLEFSGLRETYWYDPTTFVVHDIAIPVQQAEIRLISTAPAGTPLPTPAPAPAAAPTVSPGRASHH